MNQTPAAASAPASRPEEEVEALGQRFAAICDEIGRMASSIGLPADSAELNDVLKTTQEATDAILDAAARIGMLAGDGEESGEIAAQLTRIYEACSFQDLTGQRIRKVMKNLGLLGSHIERLYAGSGAGTVPTPAAEDSLLNGPQPLATAPSQSDVDRIFGS